MRAFPRIVGSVRVTVPAAAGALALAGALEALPADGSSAHPTSQPTPRPVPGARPPAPPLDGLAVAGAVPPLDGLRGARQPPLHYLVARVTKRLPLQARPGGRVQKVLGPRTAFGSPRVLSVARTRGRWLGVITSTRPNGRLTWVDRRAPGLRLARTPYSLHADLSRRAIELRRGRRPVTVVPVGVGAPNTPTPTGRFAVTDKLRGPGVRPVYGCCVVALSGFQPRPPPRWRNGTRLAVHGTPRPGTVGTASSAGCLRADARVMRMLMRQVPLGAPVFIRP